MATAAQCTAGQTGNESQQIMEVPTWTSTHNPAAATQATTTKAAGATGVRHICRSITATIACGATAQTPINVYLRDGTAGAGTIIWGASIAAPANGSGIIIADGLSIVGTAATAMTLEFSAAGVAASVESVTLCGCDVV